MNRIATSSLAAMLTSGVIIAGALTPAAPASAAAQCFDHVSFRARAATVVGTAGKDLINAGHDAVVSAQANDDQVFANAGIARVTACLDAGNDNFSQAKGAPPVVSLFSVRGGDGNDGMLGGGGPDHLYGEAGVDTIFSGGGDDQVNGGDGDDTLIGEAGSDTIRGGAGADFIEGGDGNDIIYADPTDRKVDGGPGVDYCIGVSPYAEPPFRPANCESFG